MLTIRSKMKLEKRDKNLILTIEARDTIALRAASNSYLRWISAVYGVISTLDSLTLSNEL